MAKNYSRIRQARLRRVLKSSVIRQLLWLLMFAGVGAAVAAFFLHMPLLYVGGTIAAPLFMMLEWYKGELAELTPTQGVHEATDVTDVLEADLLALIGTKSLSAKALFEMLATTRGGYFYAVRFTLPVKSLMAEVTDAPGSGDQILAAGRLLAEERQAQQLDSAAVTAAAILALPDVQGLLAKFNLDMEDIIEGYDWYLHEQATWHAVQQKHQYGGIGRDLSFGYTPLLDQMGHNITVDIERHGLLFRQPEGREGVIQQVASSLSSAGRQNIVLVGETGSGRTTIVYALAERLLVNKRLAPNIRYHQIISLDASSILSRAKGRGDLEQMMIRILNEAIKAKNIILFLDEAHLFLQDGNGSVDLSNILLPVLQGGSVRIVLTMDDTWWQRLSQSNSSMAQLLNRTSVEPLSKDDTFSVMEDQVLLLEHRHKVVFTYRALTEAYQLAERFIHDQVMPGKSIGLLEASAMLADSGFVTDKVVQEAIEQRYGVKVRSVNEASERNALLNLEESIHQRMINQSRAVSRVADALRRARAGVRNTQRPVGTFLFLGPTGVGKTELSKSLAAVYYGGEDHLIRIDLNEYSSAGDVTRLIESASTNALSLCAMVAKQPFSVVLLDEIEKAHPNVLNALLQLIDEGVLRDANNREVNFRETIIIATSNAGADNIRAHIDKGEHLEQFEEQFVTELIDSNQFKPEFLNRFDEIILFRPLTKEELLQVVDLLAAGLNKTLANQKLTVDLTVDAKQWLVEQGYDPRLGARPLRRVVQRTVESLVAKKVLAGQAAPGSVITLTAADLMTTTDTGDAA